MKASHATGIFNDYKSVTRNWYSSSHDSDLQLLISEILKIDDNELAGLP